MSNFFVSEDEFSNNPIIISGDEANHAIKVLRMKEGESLTVFDGRGHCAEAVVEKIDKSLVYVNAIRRYDSESEPQLKITLFQGVPKNPKMDLIIQKATEIGVCRIVPVQTKRSVAKIEKDSKIERLRRIAFEAAKQCGRAFVPQVENPMSFDEALKSAEDFEAKIVPYECEKDDGISNYIKKGVKSLAIFIGPEGGFEDWEIAKAESMGIHKVTLGKRILRTETAGLVASTICLYLTGDMG